MTDTRIAIIGAGSAAFSLALVSDICQTENLEGSTIAMMDIDGKRLDAVHSLCNRYAGELGVRLNVEKTLDREEAIEGAQFVINTAMAYPPGYHRVMDGWEIARKHGYRFGDSHHIMEDGFWLDHYQFELFKSIAESMLDSCPDAWYVQLANPVLQGVTLLHRKYPGLKKVGLCHGFGGVYRICRQLGLEEENISFTAPGVNHFIWLTRFEYEGRDAYPMLDDWIRDESREYWESCGICDQMGPVPVDLYRRFGVFPIGDTCTPGGGSWPWWYHVDDETERRWRVDPRKWWEGYFENSRKKTERMIEVSKSTTRVTEEYAPGRTGELVIPLVESIACDLPRTLQVNIGNSEGLLPGVPEDFEVEIPATVNGRGIEGNRVEGLPVAVNAFLLRDRIAPVEVELRAYMEESREGLLELILMDPWTTSLVQAEGLLDDILSMAHHKELKEYYS